MLDKRIGHDVTVGIDLPDEALGAVRCIIRDVAKSVYGPPSRTGMLIRLLLEIGTEYDLQDTIKVSSCRDYTGYVMAVSFEDKRVCVQGAHTVDYVDFDDIDTWVREG